MQRSRMAKLRLPAVSIAMGAAAATVAYYYLMKMSPWPPALKAATVGLVFTLAAAVAAGWMITVVRRCLPALTCRQAVVGIVLGLACGWGLVIVIPVMPPRGLMPEHWLQVIASGERNSLSSSPAVWVIGLMERRTRRLAANAYDFHQDGNWHALTPEAIFTETAGTLTWNGRVTAAVALKIYASRGAGKVRIVWDGKEQVARSLLPSRPRNPPDDPSGIVRDAGLLDAQTDLGLGLRRRLHGISPGDDSALAPQPPE